jgi:S-adenosylhomocysteine hydrolase
MSRPEPSAVALVCVQHLLQTTGSLIEKFIDVGFVPHQIHVLGKLYSTNTPVQQQLRALGVHVYMNGSNFRWGQYSGQLADDISNMWQTAMSTGAFDHVTRIVVLDDGGGSIAAVPRALLDSKTVIGVEQTMNGITLSRSVKPLIPYIGVGSSAAKVLIEPRIIRESLIRCVAEAVPLQSGTAGIVGIGNIGQAVSEGLQAAGVEVFTYDHHVRQISDRRRHCETLADLYRSSDTIWGCTGTDHLSGHSWMDYLAKGKTLISCSSKDSEYKTALQLLNSKPEHDASSRLSDVVLRTASFLTTILHGGFPINFSRTSEAEPARDIQLTRALLFLGVTQAVTSDERIQSGAEVPLDPRGQLEAVRHWLEMYPERRSWYPTPVIDVFSGKGCVASYQKIRA